MKTLATYRHALLALACAVGALAFLGLVPEERLDKLALLVGALYARVTEEPTAAAAFVTFIVGALTTLRGAWVRTPPAQPAPTPQTIFGDKLVTHVRAEDVRTDATLLRDDGEPKDDSDDPPPPASSDGPPTTPRRRPTLPPDRIERDGSHADSLGNQDVSAESLANRESGSQACREVQLVQIDKFSPDPLTSPLLFALLGPACPLRDRYRDAFWLGFWQGGRAYALPVLASWLLVLALALTGCGASALRTHSTIATVARVSVVTAGEAIARTCEVALSRCTDEACVERTSADCTVAGTAAEAAIDGVRAYVDVIEVAALADEGQVAASLDLAVQTMARLYNALRDALASLPSLGVTLPPLPPIAIAVLRALAEQLTGGAS